MSPFVWLTSYPKSGNTWFRTLLTNYYRDADEPASINGLLASPVSAARAILDYFTGVELTNWTDDEIDLYRPQIFREFAQQLINRVYIKTHDAYQVNKLGEPLFPADVSFGVIYLVRNPLDVCLSYANHNSTTPDNMVAAMNDDEHSLAGSYYDTAMQIRQRLLSWSNHVRTWLDQTEMPVHLVRYEDLHRDPVKFFTGALEFLEEDVTPERIEKAVRFSDFNVLKKQETENGFREKPFNNESFFYKGKVGAWRTALDDELRDTLIANHGEIMSRLGYLDEAGQLVF